MLVVVLSGIPRATRGDNDVAQFDEHLRPFLDRHCAACHGGEKPQGNLRLDQLTLELKIQTTREHWANVLDRLTAGEMPPKEEPRPSELEIREFRDWLAPRISAAEASVRAAQGRVPIRRLNRSEYENTLRDLLDIDIDVKELLPLDGAADGFDNASAANHTSSFLMEKYLEVADLALNAAIANRPEPPPSKLTQYNMQETHGVKASTEDVYRFGDEGEVICFCSSEWHNLWVSHFYPNEPGTFRFRMSASALQSKDKPLTFRVTVNGQPLTGRSGLVGYFDALPDEPTVFEFVRTMKPRTTISILPYGLDGANTVKTVGGEKWEGPGLAVQYVTIEGPLNPLWPPQSHRSLFGDLPQTKVPQYNFSDRVEVASENPLPDAERILQTFVRRAFRRPVTADDIAPFTAIVNSKIDDGETFEMAVRAALKGVLISPEFLFLRETPGRLDDFSLASRLSYFLWSTMPDEELLQLAEQQQLSDPQVLHSQVERLLESPKAAAFTENFAGQWLGLREIDATDPSHILYPEFDHLLKVSMIRETELFFEEILRQNLSLENFVASKFSMLNGRLAKHYGISGVDGWEFHKTSLPPESHRGGVLTMASVLKVTANGTTTSPVSRGAWVLDRILGTPPAPPPDNISAIDPDTRGATTIREQLAKHRAVESCGACHREIDPPGFALESFDCIGTWREHYRATGNGEAVIINGRRMNYLRGKPVDPSDVMPDGAPFENIDQFKQLLLREKPQIARSLTKKLITYATGRAPQKTDREAVELIVSQSAEQAYGFRSLVHEVVQSSLFREK